MGPRRTTSAAKHAQKTLCLKESRPEGDGPQVCPITPSQRIMLPIRTPQASVKPLDAQTLHIWDMITALWLIKRPYFCDKNGSQALTGSEQAWRDAVPDVSPGA